MMYPFWVLCSLYALVTLLEIAAARRAAVIRSAAHRWIPAAICLTALVFAVLLRASPADLFKQRGPQPRIGSPNTALFPQEISLHSGECYRRSGATLPRSAASPLRQRLLCIAEVPV